MVLFFKAAIGLKPDKTNAGYKPDNNETIIHNPIKSNRLFTFNQASGIFLSRKVLSEGRNSRTEKAAATKTKAVSKKVSDRNCLTRCSRVAPIVFLTPTSFDFFNASAVERFV